MPGVTVVTVVIVVIVVRVVTVVTRKSCENKKKTYSPKKLFSLPKKCYTLFFFTKKKSQNKKNKKTLKNANLKF